MSCKRSPLCLAALSLVLYGILPPPAAAGVLPDAVGPWHGASVDVTSFKTASEDLGAWHNRVYTRSAPPARVTAILMEGPGPGTLRVPQSTVSDDDLPVGFGARYQTLEVAGRRAVLERHPLLGLVLAVDLGGNRTLTLESSGASQEELAELAEGIFAFPGNAD